MKHLPPSVPTTSPAPSVWGEGHLPSCKSIPSDSEEFREIVRKNVPEGLGGAVLEQLQSEQTALSIGRKLFTVLFFAAVAGALYLVFPRTTPTMPGEPDALPIESPAPRLSADSRYAELGKTAEREFREGKYETLRKRLVDPVREIVSAHRKTDYQLPFLYFLAGERAGIPADAEARFILGILTGDAPDDLCWRWFSFSQRESRKQLLDYAGLKNEILSGRCRKDWKIRHEEAADGLRDIRRMRTILQSRPPRTAERERWEAELDLAECRLLLARWLLSGGRGEAVWDDDEDDPGVFERELALRIALRRNRKNWAEFWRIRRFIAATLLSQGGNWYNRANFYFWNGRTRYRMEPLQHELELCDRQLNFKNEE